MADDMFTGFGLRTLSSGNPGFNPLSYHCGSVWPHDTAIVAAGMLQNGQRDQGQRLAMALLDAAVEFDGRLPELFGGFARADDEVPVPYPTSCSPQAWAAAAPILLIRALLGLEPHVPHGTVTLDPSLPDDMWVSLRDVRLGPERLSVEATGGHVDSIDTTAGLRASVRTPG
jgi:glycogen debranching enzyme